MHVDPFLRYLEAAPVDDEPVTVEEDARSPRWRRIVAPEARPRLDSTRERVLNRVPRQLGVPDNRSGRPQKPRQALPIERLDLADAGTASSHYSYDAAKRQLV